MINAQKNIRVDNLDDFKNEIFPRELMFLEGTFSGIVTRCIDKARPGWIKVSIYGVTDDLPVKDQPWAEPPPMQNFQIPDPGASVFITFRDGDVHYPIWHTSTSQNNGKFFPTHEYNDDYPNNHILYNSADGTIVKNNRKTGNLVIEHASGTKLTISKDGNMTIVKDGLLAAQYSPFKVVTAAAQCPFLASIGAPPIHPIGLGPILTIDDIGIPQEPS